MFQVSFSEQRDIEFHNLAVVLVPQHSANLGFDWLLVTDTPVDVFEPDHRFMPTPLSGPEW